MTVPKQTPTHRKILHVKPPTRPPTHYPLRRPLRPTFTSCCRVQVIILANCSSDDTTSQTGCKHSRSRSQDFKTATCAESCSGEVDTPKPGSSERHTDMDVCGDKARSRSLDPGGRFEGSRLPLENRGDEEKEEDEEWEGKWSYTRPYPCEGPQGEEGYVFCVRQVYSRLVENILLENGWLDERYLPQVMGEMVGFCLLPKRKMSS